jgi:hypothetical protein
LCNSTVNTPSFIRAEAAIKRAGDSVIPACLHVACAREKSLNASSAAALILEEITVAGITGETRFGDYSSVAVDPVSAARACAVTVSFDR